MEDSVCLANVVAYFLVTAGHAFNSAISVFGYVLIAVCLIAECVLFYRKAASRSGFWRILGYMLLNLVFMAIRLL